MCRFPALLRDLEDSKAELGVNSYGLEVTTLEEVFLAVSAAASADAKAARRRSTQPAPSARAAAEEKAEVAVDVDTLHEPAHGRSNGAKGDEQHVQLLKVSPCQCQVQLFSAILKRVPGTAILIVSLDDRNHQIHDDLPLPLCNIFC